MSIAPVPCTSLGCSKPPVPGITKCSTHQRYAAPGQEPLQHLYAVSYGGEIREYLVWRRTACYAWVSIADARSQWWDRKETAHWTTFPTRADAEQHARHTKADLAESAVTRLVESISMARAYAHGFAYASVEQVRTLEDTLATAHERLAELSALLQPRRVELRCACSDAGCPEHEGQRDCDRLQEVVLTRTDMEDATVRMCGGCAQDALSTGLFAEVQ